MSANIAVNSLPQSLEFLLGYHRQELEDQRRRNPDRAIQDMYDVDRDPQFMARVLARAKQDQYKAAKLRNLAPLWKYSNEFVDDAVVRIGREGLVIAGDRMDQFSVPMPNWLSILVLTSHKVSEARRAQRGMVPGSKGEGGIQDKTPYSIPIYVTWDEFAFNARELAAAERSGHPLDTDEVEQSVRNVNYAVEDAIINGLTENVSGLSSPGLLDTTNTQAYETNTAWDDAGKTGAEILTDVLAMRAVLAADKFYGPYTLYIPTSYGAALQKPFDSTGGGGTSVTTQRFLEQLTFGGRNLRVVTADLLPANRTLLVQDNASVCDVIVGAQVSTINPSPEYEWHTRWTTFACIVPRVKSDYAGNFGVCAGNTT